MNSDRDEIRGGANSPVDDQSDAEPVQTTGEFTIEYAPPAWYTQSTSDSSTQEPDPVTPVPGPAPPPAHTPPPVRSGPPMGAGSRARSVMERRIPAGLDTLTAGRARGRGCAGARTGCGTGADAAAKAAGAGEAGAGSRGARWWRRGERRDHEVLTGRAET